MNYLNIARKCRLPLAMLLLTVMTNAIPAGEQLRLMEEMVALHERLIPAAESLAELLSTVKDQESAMKASPKLPAAFGKFQKELEALAEFLKKGNRFATAPPPVDPQEIEKLNEIGKRQPELTQAWLQSGAAVSRENKRIDSLKSLPQKFWNVYRLEGTRMALSMGSQAMSMGPNGAHSPTAFMAVDYFKETLALMEKYGVDKVVQVHIEGVLPDRLFSIIAQCHVSLRTKLEMAQTFDPQKGNGLLTLAPVEDFNKLVKALPAGKSKEHDRARGFIRIVLSETPIEVALLEAAGRMSPNSLLELPAADDPDYHEKLADLIVFGEEAAIDALLKIKPSEIKSKEVRKLIARNFRELAFNQASPGVESKAIRGLVRYGGKYSIPILIDLLRRNRLGANEEIFNALASFSDAKAAEAVARVLGDFFNHAKAVSCLRRMGPVAEQALIDVAPSNDPKVAIAAVELLGDVGSEKSFPLLRKAAKSRNPEVRRLAINSIKKIKERQPAEEASTASP